MNNLSRALMSGASLAALALGSVDGARAAGITVNGTVASVTVATGSAQDFILVNPTGVVTNDVTNDGTVGLPSNTFGIGVDGGEVGGSIVNGGDIVAAAAGIVANSGAQVHGNISNLGDGKITVSATGVAGATIAGIYDGGGLKGSIVNSGDISVFASGTSSALGVGIFQTESANEIVSNSGTIDVSGLGVQLAGVEQFASGAAAANISLDNVAGALIQVSESRTFGSGVAIRSLRGVEQEAIGGSSNGIASLANEGTIAVAAHAVASATFAAAHADIDYGVFQEADAGAASTASVTFSNSGTMTLDAVATADAVLSAHAQAGFGTGITQTAESSTNSVATITNSGTLTFEALAKAVATLGTAAATASMSAGIEQHATGEGTAAAKAAASLVNSGTLNVALHATATGASHAGATAMLSDDGLEQEVWNAGTVSATLTNSSTITIVADAKANATAGIAQVQAQIVDGVYQSASAIPGGTSPSAAVSLNNSGTLDVEALARATGASGAAAHATNYVGLSQYAAARSGDSASTASVTLTNSGTVNIIAQATANGGADRGFASAYMDTGVDQYAVANSQTGSSANASLANSGALNIVVGARATGNTEATAIAFLSTGIGQYAYHGDADTVSLTNSGTIELAADAKASGTQAMASATVGLGIYQGAGNVESATVSLANSGTLDVTAHASASDASAFAGVGGSGPSAPTARPASASAGIVGLGFIFGSVTSAGAGIEQSATGSSITSTASADLANSGTIDIVAEATAKGAIAQASASEIGVLQLVTDAGTLGNTLTNSGGTLVVAASAIATGTSGAVVRAGMAGIIQDVSAVGTASAAVTGTNEITNSGTISIAAKASAAASGVGEANALEFASGILQLEHPPLPSRGSTSSASSTVPSASESMSNTLTNSGTIAVHANAAANDASQATAGAAAIGIFQLAAGSADTATTSNTLTNSGTITVGATAVASGTAEGHANAVADGFVQAADAVGTSGSASIAIASDSLTNSGTISVGARATAHGSSAGAGALAIGIEQHALSSFKASASLINSGTLQITVHAAATDASANAEAGAGAGFLLSGADSLATPAIGGAVVQALTGVGDAQSLSASLVNSGAIIVVADATAQGTDASPGAGAGVGGIAQLLQNDGNGTTTEVNTLTNSGAISVQAVALAKGAFIGSGVTSASTSTSAFTSTPTSLSAKAVAAVNGVQQFAELSATNADVTNTLTNSGTITIGAKATATASPGTAVASAVEVGIRQNAQASGTTATDGNALTNSGVISVQATALAKGATVFPATASGAGFTAVVGHALASVNGVEQIAEVLANNADVTNTLMNSGTITVDAKASAATADAFADGILQNANASGATATADNTLTNSGTIAVSVSAVAHGQGTFAKGQEQGILQQAAAAGTADTIASASDNLTNAGMIEVAVHAAGTDVLAAAGRTGLVHFSAHTTTGITQHSTTVRFGTAVVQSVGGLDNTGLLSASLTNSGTIGVAADATAHADVAHVTVDAGGVGQFALGGEAMTLTAANSGTLSVSAEGSAEIADLGSVAVAAYGARQRAYVHVATTSESVSSATIGESFTNSGSLSVDAAAKVAGSAGAEAFAQGVEQLVNATAALSFANTGHIDIEAHAVATGATGALAHAAAVGVEGTQGSQEAPGSIAVSYSNSGSLHVAAEANAGSGSANATALGMRLVVSPMDVSGTVANDGTLNVRAKGGFLVLAKGISVLADGFTGIITNNGALTVAASGLVASATGIAITGFAAGTGTGTVVNDGGTLWVGNTIAGTTTRGVAINVSNASNAINIVLEGTSRDGHIYGDIFNANGDTITVTKGRTIFDGVVNAPSWLAGTMSISADGTLEFVNNTAEGPAHVYVGAYNQAGALELQINPSPVAVSPTATSTAGFVSANSATLGGTVVLDAAPGLYNNSTTYQVVFSANPISGTWTNVSLSDNSAILQASAQYSTNEADIVLTRMPFNAVTGLTPNEQAVATGIENSYSTGLNGAYATLVSDLLTLDPSHYKEALDILGDTENGELSLANIDGVEAALQALSAHLGIFANANNSAQNDSGPAQVMPAQLTPLMFGKGQVWTGGFGSWTNIDATISGPKASGSQAGFVVGLDVPVNKNTVVGAAISYASGALSINGGPSHGSYEGWQALAYGRYDDDAAPWYVMGSASFGGYTNHSKRLAVIPGPLGGSGILSGRFFSRVWSFYGEGGYRLDTGTPFTITPYLGLELLEGNSGSYTETETTLLSGSPIPPLAVGSTSATSFSTRLGVDLETTTTLGEQTVFPSLKIAWLHEFNNNPWVVNAAFAGVPTSGFRVTGTALSGDFAYINAGLGVQLQDGLDALINYEGRLSSDRQDNSIIGRIVFKL